MINKTHVYCYTVLPFSFSLVVVTTWVGLPLPWAHSLYRGVVPQKPVALRPARSWLGVALGVEAGWCAWLGVAKTL